jgi:hypothetical protein
MTIEHVIEPGDRGTLITERMIMKGLVAPLVAGLMRGASSRPTSKRRSTAPASPRRG